MHFSSSFLTIQSAFCLLVTTASAAYTIQDDYSSSKFADMFDFFTANDPTNGYVNYVSRDVAQNSGLYSVQNGAIRMAVDSTNVATGRGRDSIRVSSKNSYNHGLIILDLAHMPAGACGTWPAFWLVGPNWPNSGELDIIEGVNGQKTNSMAMHTNPGCSITQTGAFGGELVTSNCDVNAPGQGTNVGCVVHTANAQTYGDGFNAAGGGVYATEWTSQAINIWFFARGAIPADVTNGNPNPANWGLPMAQFAGACDLDKHMVNQQIVFDVTFCGDWAGQVWGQDSTCAPKASTCQGFVQNNPTAFKDMYWLINSLKVYQNNGAAASIPPATSSIAPAPATTQTPVPNLPTSPVSSPLVPSTLTTLISTTTTVVNNPTTTTFAPPSTTATPPPPATTNTPPPPASTNIPVPATSNPPPPAATTNNPAPAPAPPAATAAPVPAPAPAPDQAGGNSWAGWSSHGGWGGNGGGSTWSGSWGGGSWGGNRGGGSGGWGGRWGIRK